MYISTRICQWSILQYTPQYCS